MSNRRSRIWIEGGGGGGSTDASGSVLCSRFLILGLNNSTPTNTTKGRAGATFCCSTLPDGNNHTRRFCTTPSTMDQNRARGRLRKLASAAAVSPATKRVVKSRV